MTGSGRGSAGSVDASFVRLRGVWRSYPSPEGVVTALKNVDLDIFAGEMVAVVGPSGSGKSTCANIIGCLDTPTKGTYRVDGRDVGSLDAHQRALLRRSLISFVFQSYNLMSRATALENVALPLVYRGVPARERSERARAALHEVGLASKAEQLPSALSGGQQQRVAIARAIVGEPKLIIADEPTAALDMVNARGVVDTLTRLSRGAGITVLIVTHDPGVARCADRTVEFAGGRILRTETRREAC